MRTLRLPASTWPAFLALFAFSALVIGAMVYVLQTGTRLTVRHAPLLKAAMEIRLEAGEAHLWLEEILSGDPKADVLDVWPHLDAADWYAAAMLRGGANEEVRIEPLDDPELREKIREVRARLADFREITALRLEQRAAPGTRIDQQYDEVFRDFVRIADEVETSIRRLVAGDLQAFRRTQIALIAGAALLTVVLALGMAAYLAERERARREADALRKELSHVTRVGMVGEMAAGIAHEVNQPLTAIATWAQALRRLVESGRHEDAEIRATLDRIVEQALRAGAVIKRLRTLLARDRMRAERVDVNELAEAARRLAEDETALGKVRVRLDLDPDLPFVTGDPVLIQQVLVNLVRNGAEAMNGAAGEDEIVIRTQPGDRPGIVEVTVADRGTGVSDEVAQALFQPFYTTKKDGFGMGLSLSRTIVAAHGGRLWFTNNPDRGATLHFTLLATREDPS